MEPEGFSRNGGATAPGADAITPAGVGARSGAARRETRTIDGRAEDRHMWALAALVFPLVFCAIVAMGVYLMFHRNMGYFKPAPSGSTTPRAAPIGLAEASPALMPAFHRGN